MARRQRERTERTRRALLSAARSLFAEQGYGKTTVADITRAAGRAHGTFYLYFDNKRDVFSALLATMGETITDHARDLWRGQSPVEAIWLGVRDFFEQVNASRDLWQLMEEMAAVDDGAARLRADLRQSFASRIARGIELSGDGSPQQLDPLITAELLTAIVFRFARRDYLPGDVDTVAFHVTMLWARGLEFPESTLHQLRERVGAGA